MTADRSLVEVVASTEPTSVALIQGDRRVTYGELSELMVRTAGGIVQRGGVPGSRVAVAAPSAIDTIVAYLGVQAAGCICVMLNPRAPRPELQQRLEMVDPALVVLGGPEVELPEGLAVHRPAGASGDGPEVLDETPSGGVQAMVRALAAGDTAASDGDRRREGLAPDDPAVVLFTSGVAGPPQGVVLTHRNLSAVQLGLVQQPNSGLDASSVGLCVLPLAHVFGLNSMLGAMLRAGASVVIADGFDAEAALELVKQHQVTVLTAVPQMWAAWAGLEGASGDALSSVLRATSSAAHLPVSTAAEMFDRFGVRVAAGYGLTETAGTIVLDDLTDPVPGTVGRPLGETEIRLVDVDGHAVDQGDPGEIWVRGPSVFGSYSGGGPVIRSMLAPGGWCRTGDVGVFDEDGRLSVVDRLKDVIIVGGFNVAPTEVEDVLCGHPSVEAALVVGEPDDRSGERVVAFVTSANGSTVDPAELIEHCRRRLARYKVPRRIEVRDRLPTTEAGKAVRRLAR